MGLRLLPFYFLKRWRSQMMTSWLVMILLVVFLRVFILRISYDLQRSQYKVLPVEASTHRPLHQDDTGLDVKNRTTSLTTHHARCARRPAHVLPLVHDQWHAYFRPPTHRAVYIYSAYMDARAQNAVPQVRLLAVSSTIRKHTFCQFWYENEDEPVPVNLTITKNGRGHRIEGTHYEQYYFSCPVPRPHPVLVSVTSQPCESPQSLIPITYPARGLEHQFAVCVPITFGTVDPYQLVEWVEALRILGVTEINVYYVHLSARDLSPFRYYENEGILKLHNIPTVPRWVNTYDGNKLSSMVSLNDCLYKNMYRIKWLVGIDFDELIVPKSAHVKNYAAMLAAIDKKLDKKRYDGVKSYTFHNAYFWIGCGPPRFDTPAYAVMLRHVRREPANGRMFAPKTMLSPLSCVSLFNHYCYHPFKVQGKPATIDVDSAIATSHHYRRIKNRRANCAALTRSGTDDLTIHNLKPQLEQRYLAVVADMKL